MTSPNNPFVKYLQNPQSSSEPNQNNDSPQEAQTISKEPKINPFVAYIEKNKPTEFPIENENDLERDIEKSQAITTSRIGESLLGAPGDIASFVTSIFGGEQNVLPTSQGLRKLSEKASLGYTKPENEAQEVFSELSSDIGSMMFPGGGSYSFARNIGIPVVGNLVKSGLKYGNAGEEAEAYGKVGTMVALDLMSRKSGGVKKYMTDLFSKAEQNLPKGVSVKASGLESSLEELAKEMRKGGKKGSTIKSLEKITELKNDIHNGKIDVSTLAAYRPSINEAIEELGGFSSDVAQKYKPKAIRNLNEVKDKVISTLSEYGKKFNPEFYKYHQAANESWSAYAQSNKIAKFLQDKVGYIPKGKAIQALFSYGSTPVIVGGLSMMGPGAALAGTAGAAGYQTFKILNRVMKSPTLRKYYGNVLKEASAGNAAATSKNLKALDLLLKPMDDPLHEEIEKKK